MDKFLIISNSVRACVRACACNARMLYYITSKIPVRWPGQCYGFTLSLIFKYYGGI